MTKQRFAKLEACGNDFVLVADWQRLASPDALALQMADRHYGVGFDQLMLVHRTKSGYGYRVFNADGSEAQQCGNGARAVAFWLIDEKLIQVPFVLDSPAGPIDVEIISDQMTLTLSEPNFAPSSLPMLGTLDELCIDGHRIQGAVLSLGNPHLTVWVDDVSKAPVQRLGDALQRHPQFPERVNVGFCQLIDRTHAKLRVFERGAGETLACGSGACAAAIQLIQHGLADESVKLTLPGGELFVSWKGPGHRVRLGGTVRLVFTGEFIL